MIHNYLGYIKLLRAICYSDNDKYNGNGVICVYDKFDNDLLVAVFSTSKRVAEFSSTTPEVINCRIARKQYYKDRYLFKRVKIEEE